MCAETVDAGGRGLSSLDSEVLWEMVHQYGLPAMLRDVARRAEAAQTIRPIPEGQRYDVRASAYDAEGGGDGAYDLIGDGKTAAEVLADLAEVLTGDFVLLANARGACSLETNIGPAGTGDDLPL